MTRPKSSRKGVPRKREGENSERDHGYKLLEPDQRLPAILPVVLYQGKQGWKAPQDLRSLFVEVPRELKGFLPKLKYLLLDESRLPLDRPELRDNLAAALFRLERAAPEEAVARVRDLDALTPPDQASLRRAFSVWLTRLFRKFPLGGTMTSEIDLENTPMLEQTLQEWAERLQQESRQQGLQEGEIQGIKKGEIQGLRKAVLHMLHDRFGPIPQPVRRRVEELSPSELREVIRRILTAKSLQDTGLL